MAVSEFLENVDLAALGLSRPLPSLTLTPILARSASEGAVEGTVAAPGGVGTGGVLGGISPGLRGRVEQQVDAIAVSANKVLAGVMDTSFGMLKSLIPQQQQPQQQPLRESGFSLSSIAASIPITIPQAMASSSSARKPSGGGDDPEDGQQMVTVSRPAEGGEGEGEGEGEEEEEQVVVDGEGVEEDVDGEDLTPTQPFDRGSVRSIKSFESMMSERSAGKKKVRLGKGGVVVSDVFRSGGQRKSLSDRLANMSALAGIKVRFFLLVFVACVLTD